MGRFDNVKLKKIEMADAWDFEKNKTMLGQFIGKQENVGPNGSFLYTFELEDGSLTSVWGSTILDVRLKNVKEGEIVEIKYLGEEASEKRRGSKYKNFEVSHGYLDEEIPVEAIDFTDLDGTK